MNSHSPGGAPQFVVMVVDMVLLILTHCFLSVRKSQIHFRKDGFTSMALIFWSRICGWIVVNALEKSKKRKRAEVLSVSMYF